MNLVFRHGVDLEGRESILDDSNSDLEHLAYARIALTERTGGVTLYSRERETVLMCVKGQCRALLSGGGHTMSFQDALYIPRGCECRLESRDGAELVEGSAPSELDRQPAFSPFSGIRDHEVYHRKKGDPEKGTYRDSYVHFGPDFEASRILFGFARIRAGNWSSWPPHEHKTKLEEIYIYYDMPSPGFGIQLVFDEVKKPMHCGIVSDGDAVLVSKGFHPCISAPGYQANYIWILATRGTTERKTTPNPHPVFT